MNILLAASEVVPYAKTGGLADVAGALPKALAQTGHNVSVVMPRYNLPKISGLGEQMPGALMVPFDFEQRPVSVFVDRSGPVPVYFIDAPQYYSRPGLYGEPDDAERFGFFSRAVLELAKALGEQLDILHLNDWMTGLTCAYLRTVYSNDLFFSRTKTLFTIHNMAFPGVFSPSLLPKLGLPEWLNRTDDGIEFYGDVSSLKAGLVFANAISTVSPKYSKEIQTEEFGEKFEGLLRARSHVLFGILNGVDYDEWDPSNDSLIAARYSPDDTSGKTECKRDLLRSFSLPEDINRPVIGCISRLSDQKGFDLILDVADRLMDRGAMLVVLGSGSEYIEKRLREMRDRRPGQLGLYIGFSNDLAHKIEAGSDMFLMPSRFEPCGLNQMYSLRYGAIPIVRAAGGLDDTIVNFDRTTRQGNGFKFHEYDSTRLLEKAYEALMVYADQELWRALMQNAMRADFSWKASAARYSELYERLAADTSAVGV